MRYRAAEKLEIIRLVEQSSLPVQRTLVACNSDIGIAFMYHEACVKESFA